ncbi:hypothetical protein JL721_8345 [Aureococcus anophagefferens]|nr:hypothetical protein JL721_8345 [Aureococcus anophagefferens]
MPVVEQPAAQAAVAVDGKGDAEPAARCCPRAERDAETGDAIYAACGGRVPARRYQCGIAVCGPGGCALCCASLCLRSVVGAAAASALSGSAAPWRPSPGLVFASNAEVRRWREADGDDRVILQATHDYLDRPSRSNMVFTAELAAMALFGAGFGAAAWAIDRRALFGMYCAGSRVETSLCRGASALLVAAAVKVAAALPLADRALRAGPRLASGAVPVVPFARDGAQGHAAAWVGVACAAFLTHRFATAVATRSMVDGALRPSAVAFLACGLAGLAVSSLARARRFATGVLACSLACHLPYAPALAAASPRFRALLCGRDVPEIPGAARPCVGLLVALAAWTAFGHYVPDPRAYAVAEVSIALALAWFAFTSGDDARAPARAGAGLRRGRRGARAGLRVRVPGSSRSSSRTLLPLAAYKFGLGALVPPATRARLAGLMVLAVATIVVEATFCDALVRVKPLPYHAAFDLLFFQVLATAALRATLLAADKDA